MPKKNEVDVLFLTHKSDLLGGGEKALFDLIVYLKTKGYTIHVIVGDKGTFVESLEKIDVAYSLIFLPFWAHGGEDPSPFHFSSLNPTVNTTLQIVNLIKAIKPRLCVTNTIVAPWLAYAASITNTPLAWMIHELGTAGLNLRYAIGESQTLRTVSNLSDIIFFNSNYTAMYYKPHLQPGIKTSIIYPGGTILQPKKVKSPYTRKTSYKICLVSQIKPQKGQLDAVKSIKSLKDKGYDVELILIGLTEDTDYIEKIKLFIASNGLGTNISFLGHKSNPSSYIALSDMSLVCATNEAFGRVTVEAMLLGKPVIAAASAGTLEIVEDGETGLLYTPADEEDLAKKIEWSINNRQKSKKMAKNAQSVSRKKYGDKRRFKPFIEYLNHIPSEKTALNLTLLDNIFTDFNRTVDMYNAALTRLEQIESSRSWIYLNKIKGLIRALKF